MEDEDVSVNFTVPAAGVIVIPVEVVISKIVPVPDRIKDSDPVKVNPLVLELDELKIAHVRLWPFRDRVPFVRVAVLAPIVTLSPSWKVPPTPLKVNVGKVFPPDVIVCVPEVPLKVNVPDGE